MATLSERKLTEKQRSFADYVAAGKNLSDSYRAAYSASRMQPSQIHSEACILAAHPKVTARIHDKRVLNERADIACQLSDKERVLAKLRDKLESGDSDAVQLRAAELLGKTVAMFTDKVIEQDDQRTPEQIRTELKELMTQVFDTAGESVN
jgi:DNA-binding ferritin-like protein (Dps family)